MRHVTAIISAIKKQVKPIRLIFSDQDNKKPTPEGPVLVKPRRALSTLAPLFQTDYTDKTNTS